MGCEREGKFADWRDGGKSGCEREEVSLLVESGVGVWRGAVGYCLGYLWCCGSACAMAMYARAVEMDGLMGMNVMSRALGAGNPVCVMRLMDFEDMNMEIGKSRDWKVESAVMIVMVW